MQTRKYYVLCNAQKPNFRTYFAEYDYGLHSNMLSRKEELKGPLDCKTLRIDKSNGNVESFVGFIQLIFEKTATTMRSTALLAYPAHVILLSLLVIRRQSLLDNGCSLVTFQPVCCSFEQLDCEQSREDEEMCVYALTSFLVLPLESGLRLSENFVGKERTMRVLHEVM